MPPTPSFDDIFTTLTAASNGDTLARIAVGNDAATNKIETKLAIAVNQLLERVEFSLTELEHTERALRESEERFAVAFHASPVALAMTGVLDGKYVEVNERFCELVGYSREELVGHSNAELGILSAQERETHAQAAQTAGGGRNVEIRLHVRDGSLRDTLYSTNVVTLQGTDHFLVTMLDITELKRAQTELQKLATTDALTDLFNRRHFFELANTELQRAIRHQQPLALALLDLDHFKHINDTFGHATGDRVLTAFAKVCKENIREIDVLARFGGEEFILLMPQTDSEQAYQVVERLRLATTQLSVEVDVQQVSLTSSFGIAVLAGEQDTLDAILQRADEALYAAKQAGRNRIAIWDESLTSLHARQSRR